MSKVMRAIDAKSFIIGVLSTVVIVMSMGGNPFDSPHSEYEMGFDKTSIYMTPDLTKGEAGEGKFVCAVEGVPFSMIGGHLLYWSRTYRVHGHKEPL